ncbi:hypothetical protein QCA50_011569 [Cerrena zonata]|uniref:Uncharacterized protein n=1 Tax=Cerrena zonata TaxID=2478898 RepID=A0AAW0FWC7_9APHY
MPLFKRKSKHLDDPRMSREKDNLVGTNHTHRHDNTLSNKQHDLLHHQDAAMAPGQQHDTVTGQGYSHNAGVGGTGVGSSGAAGAGSAMASGGAERIYDPNDYTPNPNKGGAGKFVGAAVGSAALKEQALLKEREAEVLSAQSQALAEAERLEQAAMEHRERAVADGAHPANKELGAGLKHVMEGKSRAF